jgi:chromosome segregation ATPase
VEVLKYGEEDMAAMVQQTRQEERVKYEAQVQLLMEDVSRKEVAAQRRVDRVQRECQAIRNEMKTHVSDKQKMENEIEQLKELLKTSEGTQEILHSHYNDLRAKVTEIEHQRETATKDFEGLDKSFADLHQRYLRLKQSSDSQQQVCLRVFWHCAAREMPHNL